jgi:hypothetical protein
LGSKRDDVKVTAVRNVTLVAIAISIVVDLYLLLFAPYLVLTEQRIVAFLTGAVVLFSLLPSIGALIYVEASKWINELYQDFNISSVELFLRVPASVESRPKDFLRYFPALDEGKDQDWETVIRKAWKSANRLSETEKSFVYGLLFASFIGMLLALFELLLPFGWLLLVVMADLLLTSLLFFVYLLRAYIIQQTVLLIPSPMSLDILRILKQKPEQEKDTT